MKHASLPGQTVPNAMIPPGKLIDCSRDRSAAFYIDHDNWYCDQTLDAYQENFFRNPISDGAVGGVACQYQVVKSSLVAHYLKEKTEAVLSGDQSKIDDSNLRMEAAFRGLYNRVNNGDEALVIPINTGEHWVLSIMKKGLDGRVKLYYFDPIGNGLPDIYRNLFRCNPPVGNMDVIESTQQVQHDNVNCGPYIIEAAEMFTRRLAAGDLDQAGMNGILGAMNTGEHVPDQMRLKHAQMIYSLSRTDDAMNSGTTMIQHLGSREFNHLRRLIKTGDLESCMTYVSSNKDWLRANKQSPFRTEYTDATGKVCAVETKTSDNTKIFSVPADGDYVIRVPVVTKAGELYLKNNEKLYDVLVFRSGKLASCLICDKTKMMGAHSQIDSKWLAEQKSNNRAPDFDDFNDHDGRNTPKSPAKKMNPSHDGPASGRVGGRSPSLRSISGGSGDTNGRGADHPRVTSTSSRDAALVVLAKWIYRAVTAKPIVQTTPLAPVAANHPRVTSTSSRDAALVVLAKWIYNDSKDLWMDIKPKFLTAGPRAANDFKILRSSLRSALSSTMAAINVGIRFSASQIVGLKNIFIRTMANSVVPALSRVGGGIYVGLGFLTPILKSAYTIGRNSAQSLAQGSTRYSLEGANFLADSVRAVIKKVRRVLRGKLPIAAPGQQAAENAGKITNGDVLVNMTLPLQQRADPSTRSWVDRLRCQRSNRMLPGERIEI